MENLGDLAKNLFLSLIAGVIVFKSYTKGSKDAEKGVPNKKWLNDNLGNIVALIAVATMILVIFFGSYTYNGAPISSAHKLFIVCFILGIIFIPYIWGQLMYRNKSDWNNNLKDR